MRTVGLPAVRNAEGVPAPKPKSRHRLYALALIGVVSLAAIVVVYYEYEIANPSCNGAPSSTPRVAIVTDCKLGISLRLAIKEASLPAGSNQTFYLSVENVLNRANNVTYTGVPILPSFVFFSNMGVVDLLFHPNGCQAPIPPAFIVIYNATSGKLLQLNTYSLSLVTCETAGLQSAVPGSFHFTANQNITGLFSVGGYYTSTNPSEPWLNATYHLLSPGRYNAVAFDPWKQVAKLNFTVSA